jgi:hypothetical protein
MLSFDAAALFPGSSAEELEYLDLESCGLSGIAGESRTNLHGLLALKELWLIWNDFGDNIGAGAFAEQCSMESLFFPNIINVDALANNAFAGFPHCSSISGVDGGREVCESQQHVFAEGSCNDQACRAGDCSSCYSVETCGGYAWCAWGAGGCSAPDCEEGKQPNVEEGNCEFCGAGKYSSTSGSEACESCAAGRFSEVVGSVSADDCVECEAGKVGGMDGSSCILVTGIAATADHGWDFRDCVDGEAVADSGDGSEQLLATLMGGAVCTAEGVALDGVSDYVDLDDWEWGGATTIEAYAKYESFRSWSPVFDFGNGWDSNNVYLSNEGTSSNVYWDVHRGADDKYLSTSKWDQNEWQHVVVTVEGTVMKIFKNGGLVGTKTDGHEPLVMTRTNHWLGRSNWWWEENMEGSIAYVRVWHGTALDAEGVEALYLERDV